MPRLFIAVWPSDDAVAELTAVRRKDQRGVRFVHPENWHITLRFFGEAEIGDVLSALDGVTFAPTRARLGPAVDVLAERALIVPVAGLDDIAAIVNARTSEIGEPPRRRFAGHLTLARVQKRAAMPPALGALVGAEFDVDAVTLVRSRLDPHGARYETIESWPVG